MPLIHPLFTTAEYRAMIRTSKVIRSGNLWIRRSNVYSGRTPYYWSVGKQIHGSITPSRDRARERALKWLEEI